MSEQGGDESPHNTPKDPFAPPPPYGSPPTPPYGSEQPPPYGSPPSPQYGSEQPPPYGYPSVQGGSPAYPTPPAYAGRPPYPSPYPGGAAGQWGGYPEESQGVLALVLGLIGLFVFPPVAPFAWLVGSREVRAVDAGRRHSGNRGLGVAGKVLGIIGTIFLVVIVVAVAVAIVLLVATVTTSSSTTV